LLSKLLSLWREKHQATVDLIILSGFLNLRVMIKLNNKNITYVALADSNNSLKAPKEIWYADSNNSVKLVYRRKDALIEGEDYEKYHWLVGDADAYINTLKYYRPYDDSVQMTFRDNLYPNRESKYNKHNAEEQIWGACKGNSKYAVRSYISGVGNDGTNKFSNNILDSNITESDVKWDTYAVRSYLNASPEHSLYMSSVDASTDKYYFIYNGDTKDNLPTRYTLPELIEQYVLVFYSANKTNGYFNGSFFNFIHYRNNVEITHLIPCKLLKPVPKWLDANGIRRQVGECGMIDLVSGKFYGNVNSVGTFTVENYYERKEWLVGDGDANISGTLICTDYLEWKLAQYSGQYVALNYGELSDNSHQFQLSVNNKATNGIGVFFNDTHNYVSLSQQSVNDIKFLVNSQIIGIINNVNIENNNSNLKFNGKISLNLIAKSGGISKITADNKERCIPCTLTMDLPASMDANNIARTKGTSGMWDLVSDRFYGNVASSGTFKAVNLAEGVDYEVHQWLVAQIPQIDGVNPMFKLPLNSDTFEFRIIMQSDTSINIGHIFTDKYCWYYSPTLSYIGVWDAVNGTSLLFTNIGSNDMTFKSNPSEFTINNTVITKYGFPATYKVLYNNTANANATVYNSAISVNGSIRYTPCHLLRSIPAELDANGIARQAGECGMYDTVNDKFYGNVASSGTFSVSDDS
jgi:hypothetical protein